MLELSALQENFGFASKSRLSKFILSSNGVEATHDLDRMPDSLSHDDTSSSDTSPKLASVIVAGGTGAIPEPWQFSHADLKKWLEVSNYAPDVLEYCGIPVVNFLEYDIDEAGGLSLVLQWYRNASCSLSVFGRYDSARDTIDVLVAHEAVFADEGIEAFLRKCLPDVQREPLRLLDRLLDACRSYMLAYGLDDIGELNTVEAGLGVTQSPEWFESTGHTVGGANFDDVNSTMVSVQRSLAENKNCCKSLKIFCSTLASAVETLASTCEPRNPNRRTLRALRSADARLEMSLYLFEEQQQRLNSLSSVLYNLMIQQDARLTYEIARASKVDSSAMKTISVLTLTYLPATFVSTVFSTTVFNFQNWGGSRSSSNSNNVASRGWWIYLLSCVVMTVVTFGTWIFWTRRENVAFMKDNVEEDASEESLSEGDSENGSTDEGRRTSTENETSKAEEDRPESESEPEPEPKVDRHPSTWRSMLRSRPKIQLSFA